jgi:hypothetical protein
MSSVSVALAGLAFGGRLWTTGDASGTRSGVLSVAAGTSVAAGWAAPDCSVAGAGAFVAGALVAGAFFAGAFLAGAFFAGALDVFFAGPVVDPSASASAAVGPGRGRGRVGSAE